MISVFLKIHNFLLGSFSSIVVRHTCLIMLAFVNVYEKNAGHEMAIVGEPCNVDAHAIIPALFITMPMLCVHMYCTTVHAECDRTIV